MNIDNLEFSILFDGYMDVLEETSGTYLDLKVGGNLLCYQSWTQAASPLNVKNRKAFGIPPCIFVDAVNNFHKTNVHNTIYSPTLTLMIGEGRDLCLVTCIGIKLRIDEQKNQILRLRILTNFQDVNLQKNINFDNILHAHGKTNLKTKCLFSEFRFYHINHDKYFTDNNIAFKPEEQIRDKVDFKNMLGNNDFKVIKNNFLFNDICDISYDESGNVVLMVDNEEGLRNLVMHQCWNEHDLLDANHSLNRFLSCLHPYELEIMVSTLENFIETEKLEGILPVDEFSYRPTCVMHVDGDDKAYLGVMKSFKIINELGDNLLNSKSKLKIVLSVNQIDGLASNIPPSGEKKGVFLNLDAMGLMKTRVVKHSDGRDILQSITGGSHTINEKIIVKYDPVQKRDRYFSKATNDWLVNQYWNTLPPSKRPASYSNYQVSKSGRVSKSYSPDPNEPDDQITNSKYANDLGNETGSNKNIENSKESLMEKIAYYSYGKAALEARLLEATFKSLSDIQQNPDGTLSLKDNASETLLSVILGFGEEDEPTKTQADTTGNTLGETLDEAGDSFIDKLNELLHGGDENAVAKFFKEFGIGMGNFVLMMGGFEGLRFVGGGFLRNTVVRGQSLSEWLGDSYNNTLKPIGDAWTRKFGKKGAANLKEKLDIPANEGEFVDDQLLVIEGEASQVEQAVGSVDGAGDLLGNFSEKAASNISEALEEALGADMEAVNAGLDALEEGQMGAEELADLAKSFKNVTDFIKSPEGAELIGNAKNEAMQSVIDDMGPERVQEIASNLVKRARGLLNDSAEALAAAKEAGTLTGEALESAEEALQIATEAAEAAEGIAPEIADATAEAIEGGASLTEAAAAATEAAESSMEALEALSIIGDILEL